ncbi:MAG TPA: glycosyltransferase family 4 protein [Solirubrobacteraceae bacterium]|nr:glycosyltransferase family 4 protein [Solirubrobacteraceae bacterium]
MSERPLHIAWLSPAPGEDGGVTGVATELIGGLAARGHRIDCFFPSAGQPIPERLQAEPRVVIHWGTNRFQWNRWYSRTRLTAFASGMVTRSVASLRLRKEIVAHHQRDPFDVVYQFSSIESPALPGALRRAVPLAIQPETHAAGELRAMIAERRLALRCHPLPQYLTVVAILLLRSLVQRIVIRRAALLICISGVFRDHLVHDYRFPRERTVVVPNPIRIDRFAPAEHAIGDPAEVLVLGRVAVRKGIDDAIAAARILRDRGAPVRFRVVGAGSLWSDYTPLLEDLPPENAEYAGRVDADAIAGELARSDLLLQPSRYEPFALTVAEALASGVSVVGTTEVGAIERVDREVASAAPPADPEALADAVVSALERVRSEPSRMRALARSEAERLFAAEVVCEQVAAALAEVASAPADRRS